MAVHKCTHWLDYNGTWNEPGAIHVVDDGLFAIRRVLRPVPASDLDSMLEKRKIH